MQRKQYWEKDERSASHYYKIGSSKQIFLHFRVMVIFVQHSLPSFTQFNCTESFKAIMIETSSNTLHTSHPPKNSFNQFPDRKPAVYVSYLRTRFVKGCLNVRYTLKIKAHSKSYISSHFLGFLNNTAWLPWRSTLACFGSSWKYLDAANKAGKGSNFQHIPDHRRQNHKEISQFQQHAPFFLSFPMSSFSRSRFELVS